MIYRGIEELHGTSGVYKQIIHVHSDGRFERAYVTAYADIPDSCKLWDYGEDYQGRLPEEVGLSLYLVRWAGLGKRGRRKEGLETGRKARRKA